MSSNNGGIKKEKKRRRRNYDDIDQQVQKLEESTVTKISNDNGTVAAGTIKNLEEMDSDDMNDDDLDRLMLLEEEKEKLIGSGTSYSTHALEGDEDEDGLDLSLLENEDDLGAPRRRTRGKIIDFKKTAEIIEKEHNAADRDKAATEDGTEPSDDDDDAEYVPEG